MLSELNLKARAVLEAAAARIRQGFTKNTYARTATGEPCSTCTREKGERTYHSGECADQPGMGYLRRQAPAPSKTSYPNVGTRWWSRPAPNSSVSQSAGFREICTVVNWDTANGTVIVTSDKVPPNQKFTIELAAWHDPAGGLCKEGSPVDRWCMVPVDP